MTTRIKLYLDEDVMGGSLIRALRLRNVDVTSVGDTHLLGATDEQQLDYAQSQGRVLYSFNIRDYMPLHAALLARGGSHTGIILSEQRHYSIGEQMHRLLRIIATVPAEEMQNQIIFLSAWGER